MCRRGGSLISLQKYITVQTCTDIHLCILYRGEHRKSFEHWVLCPVPIFSLVWVNCLDCDTWFDFPRISLSPLSSSTFLWNVNWTLPSVLPNHQCVWCSVFIEGRSVCCSVAVVSPLLLSAYMEQWDLSLLTVPALHLLLLWSVIHSPRPSPSKRHDKAVFCISSVWSVDCFLFAVWVLCTMGRRTCCGLSQEDQSCHAEKSASFSSIHMTSILA